LTVHFVYIKGDHISTPCAITNEVAARLNDRYPLRVYDWNEQTVIRPEAGDILIGHPNGDNPRTVYNLSFRQPGWARRIVFSPFAHAMLQYNGYIDPFAVESDLYLAICGRYWFDTNESALTSHWHYKMLHCDLAINREHFPRLKFAFNPAGRRRFLYIGHTTANKGTDFLCRLADANPGVDVGWIGHGEMSSSRVVPHGGQDFRHQVSRDLIAGYDFLLTCGRSDANPTTILEATSWGLIPVATLQSGYYENDWLVNIPLDDVSTASRILERLNHLPEEELFERQRAGFRYLDEHYNWDRLAHQVMKCLEIPIPREPTDPEWHQRKRRNQAAIRRILERERWRRRIGQVRRLPGRAARKLHRMLDLRSLRQRFRLVPGPNS
jgi:hypothetical protein